MITKFLIWDNFLYDFYKVGTFYTTPLRIMVCLILSVFSIPIDILLLPFELLSIIIFILIPNKGDDK